jgi:hypothetical protein
MGRKFFYFCTALFVSLYLIASWNGWLWEISQIQSWRWPLYSEVLAVEKPGVLTWKVPKDQWPFKEGKARIELHLNTAMAPELPLDIEQLALRWDIDAYTLDTAGNRHRRFLVGGGKPYWSGHGMGSVKFGLGYVDVRPGEELIIEAKVVTPDASLKMTFPRFKLVADHDHAIHGPFMYLKWAIEYGGLVVCLVLIWMLAVSAWRKAQQGSNNRKQIPVVLLVRKT